ncbi:osmoprotectant uptake system permease [Formosimonas limnophila]|uniref:Osmoprotectant uptake system permease n=2 Tax=Formosimonas limnophila TaxID=1384487 RepID=A0A8J3G033_9BURK|nr:osmoprotectant uptake system permease [Formosimonas limnophila]
MLPFLSSSPNRIVTATGIDFFSVFGETGRWLLLTPLLFLVAAVFVKPTRRVYLSTILAASLLMAAMFFVAGDYARQITKSGSALARVSFGGGFWLWVLLTWLMAVDAVARLTTSATYRSIGALVVFLSVAVLLSSGMLSELSMLKEYTNNRVAFDDALIRHLFIVMLTLCVTLLIGLPLGILAFRRTQLGEMIFKVLSVIQTIPSIALFGLLIAPLAALSTRYPLLADWGIKGIGVTPAVIALTLYSLLPIVRSTVAGLSQVPPAVVDAARGMGLTSWQILWRIQARLALPVLLSGLRVSTVQAVGLTVVAALIGAGGFGAIVFRGLSGSAIDLVMLGVIPVVILAVCADALFKILVSLLDKQQAVCEERKP